MSKKFWENKEFETLEQKWYAKLKKSGFEDAEKSVKGEKLLKKFAKSLTYLPQVNSAVIRDSRAAYYTMAEEKVNTSVFSESWHKVVMQSHAEGLNNTHITRKLKATGIKVNRHVVAEIIKKYMTEWNVIEVQNTNCVGATKEEKLLKFKDNNQFAEPEKSLLETEVQEIADQITNTQWNLKKKTKFD